MEEANERGRCEESLRAALFASGIELGEEQIRLLAAHLALVIEKNKVLNLTRIADPEEGAYLHVVDSLLLRGALDAAPAGSLMDVGTGAGFPGIPLAVATGRTAQLVDSVRKKVAAVEEFVRELGLAPQVQAVAARVEELGRTQRGRYAVVCARAVAQTNVLVEYAAPLLRKGGRLVVAKARPTEDEVSYAQRAAKVCGMRFVSRETFELPQGRGHREVLSYERVGNPSIKLPRAVGLAKKQPLGVLRV